MLLLLFYFDNVIIGSPQQPASSDSRPRRRKRRQRNQAVYDSEDDYDYDDPFIDDGSSDEYHPSDSEDFSETEPSQ